MQPMMEILSSQGWSNFVWALVHSLWIGALCAVGLGLFLRATPSDRADKRYNAGIFALTALIIGVLLAWGLLEVRSDRASAIKQQTTTESVASQHTSTSIVEPTPTTSSTPPSLCVALA